MLIHPHISRTVADERRRDLLAAAAEARRAARRAPVKERDDPVVAVRFGAARRLLRRALA